MCAGQIELSLPSLIAWPYFRQAVQNRCSRISNSKASSRRWAQASRKISGSGRQLRGANATTVDSSRRSSDWGTRPTAASISQSRSNSPSWNASSGLLGTSDEDDDDSDEPANEAVLAKLRELYDLMKATFFALDSDQTGHIDMVNGTAMIQKSLASAGLGALWTVMMSQADANAELTYDAFVKVFLKWAGVDESWAAGMIDRGACVRTSCALAVT